MAQDPLDTNNAPKNLQNDSSPSQVTSTSVKVPPTPSNLPTGESNRFSESSTPPRPIAPPVSNSAPMKPVTLDSQPSNNSGQNLSARSSIRTMKDDMGIPSSSNASPASPPPLFSKQPPKTTASSHSSSTVPPSASKPVIPSHSPSSNSSAHFDLPETSHSSKTAVVITAIVLIIAIIVIVWLVVFNGDGDTNTTSTPSNTATVTPVVDNKPAETIFSPVGSLVLQNETDPYSALSNAIELNKPIAGDVRLYYIVDGSDVVANHYSFSRFTSKFLINAPNEVRQSVNPSEFYFTLFRLANGKTGRGFIMRVTNPGLAELGMRQWEVNLPTDLRDMFLIDPAKAFSQDFLDTNYQNSAIRYKNFSDPFSTIDYSIITLSGGESYLLVTNTRDHMFSLLDYFFNTLRGK